MAEYEVDRGCDEGCLPEDSYGAVEHVAPEIIVGLDVWGCLTELGEDRLPEAPRADGFVEAVQGVFVFGGGEEAYDYRCCCAYRQDDGELEEGVQFNCIS